MKNEDIHKVMEILNKWALNGLNGDDPSVTRISRKTRDPFKVLISCILSLRTKDEVTHKASQRLFGIAPDVKSMEKLSISQIKKAIYPVGFYNNKAQTIGKICKILLGKHQGKVPSTLDELLSLPGVGRKTANLVLTLGFGRPGICVDTHVHRITNRWGYVNTKNPLQTELTLREKLPSCYWIQFNSILVKFGQKICRPVSPFCSRCPIKDFCSRNGVTKSR